MKSLFTICFLLLLFFAHSISVLGQTLYRSNATGNWNSTSTWQVSANGGSTWGAASSTPTNTNNSGITIQNTHTVTITVAVSIDEAVVNTGGQFNLNSGITLTIADGSGIDLTVNGTIVNSGTISPTGTISFASGGTYQHSQNGGTIPDATWDANSTLLVTGVVTAFPTFSGSGPYGNYTWNCAEQSSASNGFTKPIQGNLTIISTGSGQFRFDSGTWTIPGNYSHIGGDVRLAAGGGGGNIRTLNVDGNFDINNGIFNITGGSGTGYLYVKGNFSLTGTSQVDAGTSTNHIYFNGSGIQNYTGGGTFSGPINITINNPAGIILLTSVTFPAGLTMTNGNIALTGNTLTLGNSTVAMGTLNWSSGFITGIGTFTRWFSTAAITLGDVLGLFPMGNGTDNRSVWIAGTPSTGGTISVQHTNATGTTALSFSENSQTFDKRANMSWALSNANSFAGSSLSLRIQGSGITGINAIGDLNICLASTAADGTYSAPSGTTTDPQVNRTGLSAGNLVNTFYFAATSGSPLPVELSSFSAVILENGIQLKWRTETEVSNYGFEILRKTQDDKWDVLGFVEGHGNSNSPKDYSFVDENATAGNYSYRLKQIDTDGKFVYSKVIEVDLGSPMNFELSQNYPNPFNPSTTIRYSVSESSLINLSIFNSLGEKIEELVNELKEPGVYTVEFNAKNYPSGTYFYRIQSNDFVQTKKMILVK